MKKCPVCGVEHSDIVPVCSICGSSLNGEPTPEKAASNQPAPALVSNEGFSFEDIQAAVSSVVNEVVEEEPKHEENFEIDSPFVVDETKQDGSKKNVSTTVVTPPAAPNAPKKSFFSKKITPAVKKQEEKINTAEKEEVKPAAPAPAPAPAPKAVDPVVDTTLIAAASAAKVQEAQKNAQAARQARMNAAAQEGEQKPGEEGSHKFDWSERKHKRVQPKSNTPVIAAVCVLLALLILGLVLLIGKVMTDTGEKTQQPGEQPQIEGDQQLPADVDPENDTVIEPETDPNAPAEGEEETDPNAPAEGEEAVDPNAPAEGEEETDPNAPAEGEETDPNAPAEEEDPAPELPEMTAVDETVYATDTVRVRDYPSTETGAVIGSLTAGESVKRIGVLANGWSAVTYNGATAYVSSSYLDTAKPADGGDAQEADPTVAYAVTGVNIRETPNGTVIGTLTEGQKVTLTGKKEGNWVQIDANGIVGYVYSTYLTSTPGGQPDEGDQDEGDQERPDFQVTDEESTRYATTGVYVRDYPNGSLGKVISALSAGQQVKCTGKTSNGWYRISLNGQVGYVYGEYLSSQKPGDNDDQDDDGGDTVTGYILPDSGSRKYSASELSGMSASRLRLARNEIYARHGRKFTAADLKRYFESCSWYKGTIDGATFDANVTSYLNSYELYNLDLIRQLEG